MIHILRTKRIAAYKNTVTAERMNIFRYYLCLPDKALSFGSWATLQSQHTLEDIIEKWTEAFHFNGYYCENCSFTSKVTCIACELHTDEELPIEKHQ